MSAEMSPARSTREPGGPPPPPPMSGAALLKLDEGERLLSQTECEALVQQVYALARGGGWTGVEIYSTWEGQLRWARNRASLASDRRRVSLAVTRGVRGKVSSASSGGGQLDPASVEEVVRQAERQALFEGAAAGFPGYVVPTPEPPRPQVTIWSEATNTISAEARCGVAQAVIEPAEAQGVLSAGYLAVNTSAWLRQTNYEQERFGADHVEYKGGSELGPFAQPVPYTTYTHAQCSMTVRDQEGSGSGWAGLTSYDWTAVDVKALGAQALAKCLSSRHPVALEPGRYTVILEPQAVADLLEPLWVPIPNLGYKMGRELAEHSAASPWYLGPDPTLGIHRSKLGMKVVDERVTLSHDPSDPLLGIVPWPGLKPITWIKDGVLTALGYDRQYAIDQWRGNDAAQEFLYGYRMSGGTATLEEMIQSTKRGLLVTRFDQVVQDSFAPLNLVLCHGLTRDGLWLIENGKITKAVKNFRFTESPLFVLNSIEQLGVPVPVYRNIAPGSNTPAIVPPIKARDFSFTSLVDAV